MRLRIHGSYANLRATPNTQQSPLAKLPAGHLVESVGAAIGAWVPIQTVHKAFGLSGFVHDPLVRQETNSAVDRLIEIVGEEYERFLFGTLHESHPTAKARVRDYWLSFGSYAPDATVEPWSAAFISHAVKKANLPKTFKFAGRHTTYLSDCKRAFLNQTASKAYWAVPLKDRVLQIGDMVGAYRTGGSCGSAVRTYDSLPGDFCSHVDIVVSIVGRTATAIGGNVGDTVKVTEIPLNANGTVATGGKRITTMARKY